jgi:hypothetical protein
MEMNFDASKTVKNGKFGKKLLKKKLFNDIIFFVAQFINSKLIFLRSSKSTKIVSWHFREKNCMRLFLKICRRIHKKYQF